MIFAKRRFSAIPAAVVVLVAVTAMLAYATVTVEGVRNRISDKIRSKFKLQNLVIKVIPFVSDSLTQQGRFQSIVISADKIERKGIALRQIYIKAFDVTLDIVQLYEEGDVETKSCKRTSFSGRVYKADLNKLLALKKTPIENLKVSFENKKLVFTGKYKLAFGHNLRMVGDLRIEKRRKINFIPTAVSVNGIPLPAGPLRSMTKKLNPLIDFDKIPLKPRVDQIKIENDYVLIKSK